MNLVTAVLQDVENRHTGLALQSERHPVIVIVGRAGSGKTTLLEYAMQQNPRMVIVTGVSDVSLADQIAAIQWDDVDAVAADDFFPLFGQPDAPRQIADLVTRALEQHKRVFLSVQLDGDLERAGIVLATPPKVVNIDGLIASVMASGNEKIFMKITDLSDEEVRMFDRLSDGASSGGAAA